MATRQGREKSGDRNHGNESHIVRIGKVIREAGIRADRATALIAERWEGLMLRFVVWVYAITAIAGGTAEVVAQNYPTKPIRVITAEPGGGNDFAARLIAHGLAGVLGQQVVVENRGGGGGVMAGEAVANARPDGYTLLFYGSNIWLAKFLQERVPYDVMHDLTPVVLAVRSPHVFVVHPSLPVQSIRQLIALAKARPGDLNEAGAGTGSASHIASELFKTMARVNIVRIPYKGSGAAMNDLIAGQVQLGLFPAASVMPHVNAGRLRALAVSTAEPSVLAPGLPPVAASGLPGYESASIYGLFAPAGSPATVTARLQQEIVRFIQLRETKKKLFAGGMEVVGGSAEQFRAAIELEMARLGKVIVNAGIRAH